MNVKVVLLPDGEDPDSFAHKHNASEFYDFIQANETDFISFKTRLLLNDAQGDPVKKSSLISDIVRTIAVIPDTITRALYVKECSGLMQVDEKILHSEINKILYKNREQRWKREQPAPVNPSGEPLNLQLPVSNKYELYEKEILRLLLNYAQKVLFTIAPNDEKPEEKITTAYYICRELENEIEIQTPEFKIIYNEFRNHLSTGNLLDSTYFIHHENQLVSKAAADLLSEGHQISKMWSKKGTYISTEEDNLKKVIDNAISGYKYELVLKILHDVEKELKALNHESNNEEQLKALYEKYMLYTQFKIDISKSLGDRIILRR